MGNGYLPAAPEKNPARQRAKARSAGRTSFTFRSARGAQPVKANGAARKAHERDKRATETRLRGWAERTRTQKRRRKLSL